MRAGAVNGEAPAQHRRQRDVVRQVGARGLERLAHRAHAGRVGVARDQLVDVHRLLAAGETRQRVVAPGLVVHRAQDRELVRPLRGLRHVLANLDAGNVCLNRLELAANLHRGVRLQVPDVLRRHAAVQVDDDDVLRDGIWLVGRGVSPLGREQVRERETRAEDGRGADGERLAARDPVAEPVRVAEYAKHGPPLLEMGEIVPAEGVVPPARLSHRPRFRYHATIPTGDIHEDRGRPPHRADGRHGRGRVGGGTHARRQRPHRRRGRHRRGASRRRQHVHQQSPRRGGGPSCCGRS